MKNVITNKNKIKQENGQYSSDSDDLKDQKEENCSFIDKEMILWLFQAKEISKNFSVTSDDKL
jgi:hypothetical protein